MSIKILMFGWEFPPWNTGGLGTACHGLTKGLTNHGAKVLFVLPKGPKMDKKTHCDVLIADNIEVANVEFTEVNTLMRGYMSPEEYSYEFNRYQKLQEKDGNSEDNMYGKNLFEEVWRFTQKAGVIAKHTECDIIHAHDWMTYKAGMEAKKVNGKPFVIHVHATEFDRTGGHPNQYIYDIERQGMHAADQIICVSNYTKSMVLKHYGVSEHKIKVVHNAVEFTNYKPRNQIIKGNEKIVLFLGRITIQKGPDYFLYTAKQVLKHEPDAKFIVAGSGDMEQFLINKAAEFGIEKNFLFSGFLRGRDIDRAYKMASVYVMPSISEPFGITPLEAMRNGTPVIISKQSGVSEVITNAFKIDFWDTKEMANKIISILRYNPLQHEMSINGEREVQKFNWNEPAEKCINIYKHILSNKHSIIN